MNQPSDSEDDEPPPPRPRPAAVQAPAPAKESKKEYGFRRADGLVGPKGCVAYHQQREKYQAQASDRRTGKQVSNGYYTTPEEAEVAVRAKQDELDPPFEAMLEFQEALERTKHLPVSPDDIHEAEDGTVYRHQDQKTKFVPFAAVRGKAGKSGYIWKRACQHVDAATGAHCAHIATPTQKGAKAVFCQQHGGKCPHGGQWTTCVECNPNITQSKNNCASCGKRMSGKRLLRNGGSGYCCDCEPVLKAQAAEADTEVLPPGKRTEDVCFEIIEPLIVDENDWVISAELRDDAKNMLGAINKNGKRTRGSGGDCETNTIRRPDRLWVVRNSDGRIVAVLSLECDEHSHGPRESACEAGKVDDSFASICKIAQDEGKSTHAKFSKHHVHMPYFLTIKFNPDACDARDAEGNKIPRQVRLEAVAKIAREFLNKPAEYYEELSAKGEAMVPHVRCLYYYSGSKHLKYFEEKQHGAWDWQGNHCPLPTSAGAGSSSDAL